MRKNKAEAKTEVKKKRFLFLRAFFATVKQGIYAGLHITPVSKVSQKQETETKREPAPKPKAETTAGGTAFIAADLMLVAAFLMSALFCVCTAFIDDGRVNVVINDDGKEIACDAWPSSVGELLAKNDIEVYEHDEISCALDDEITDGMTIKITRAFPIAVESQNDVVIVKMTKGTVGEALALAGVEYDADDEISELTFADIEPGMRITHTNVEIDYKTSYEELEFNEVTVKDSSMYKGQSKVVVEGENGEKLITRRITYKNGYQFSREIVDQVILKQAVDQVTNIGSKTRYQTSYAGEWREYKEPPTAGKNGWVEMTVDYITAYTGDGITAKGTVPKLGTIAVTPQYIPYYSQIYVKNYGYGTALDTGAFRNRFENGKRVNQLDLFFNTESECRRWGRKRNVTVLVKLNK